MPPQPARTARDAGPGSRGVLTVRVRDPPALEVAALEVPDLALALLAREGLVVVAAGRRDAVRVVDRGARLAGPGVLVLPAMG